MTTDTITEHPKPRRRLVLAGAIAALLIGAAVVVAAGTDSDDSGESLDEWATRTEPMMNELTAAMDDSAYAADMYAMADLILACFDMEQAAQRLIDDPPPERDMAVPFDLAMRSFRGAGIACQDESGIGLNLAADLMFDGAEYLGRATEAMERHLQ